MKRLKMWTLQSLLILLLTAACNAATITETEATPPMNGTATDSEPSSAQPTVASETAVPAPATTEATRTIRLTPAATPQVEIVPTVDDTAVVGEVPEEIMTAVYDDLMTNQNVSQEAITVTKAESVIWSDGSLGCPQPGVFYTQATVNGYWIVLQVNGRTYDYHATENGYFILCLNNLSPLPPAAGTPTS